MHRPLKPYVSVIDRFGRGKNDRKNLRIPETVDGEVSDRLRAYMEATAACTDEQCKLDSQQAQHKMGMKLCEGRLAEYVPRYSASGVVDKEMTLPNGWKRDVKVIVEDKVRAVTTATLWQVRDVQDGRGGAV